MIKNIIFGWYITGWYNISFQCDYCDAKMCSCFVVKCLKCEKLFCEDCSFSLYDSDNNSKCLKCYWNCQLKYLKNKIQLKIFLDLTIWIGGSIWPKIRNQSHPKRLEWVSEFSLFWCSRFLFNIIYPTRMEVFLISMRTDPKYIF